MIDRRGAVGGSVTAGAATISRSRFAIFADLADKAHASSLHGANDTLLRATVVDSLARRIEARCQRRIQDDPPAPNAVDQVILGDDPVDKKVEYLRFERHWLGAASQFAPLDIEYVIAKPENHLRSLGSARVGPS